MTIQEHQPTTLIIDDNNNGGDVTGLSDDVFASKDAMEKTRVKDACKDPHDAGISPSLGEIIAKGNNAPDCHFTSLGGHGVSSDHETEDITYKNQYILFVFL